MVTTEQISLLIVFMALCLVAALFVPTLLSWRRRPPHASYNPPHLVTRPQASSFDRLARLEIYVLTPEQVAEHKRRLENRKKVREAEVWQIIHDLNHPPTHTPPRPATARRDEPVKVPPIGPLVPCVECGRNTGGYYICLYCHASQPNVKSSGVQA